MRMLHKYGTMSMIYITYIIPSYALLNRGSFCHLYTQYIYKVYMTIGLCWARNFLDGWVDSYSSHACHPKQAAIGIQTSGVVH